jgi:hypothetical protein
LLIAGRNAAKMLVRSFVGAARVRNVNVAVQLVPLLLVRLMWP